MHVEIYTTTREIFVSDEDDASEQVKLRCKTNVNLTRKKAVEKILQEISDMKALFMDSDLWSRSIKLLIKNEATYFNPAHIVYIRIVGEDEYVEKLHELYNH